MSRRKVYVLLLCSLPYCLVDRNWQLWFVCLFVFPCQWSQAQEHGFFVICEFRARVCLLIRLILQLGCSTYVAFYFFSFCPDFSWFPGIHFYKIQVIECRVLVDPILKIFHLRENASTSHNLCFLAPNSEMLHCGDAFSLTWCPENRNSRIPTH